MPQKVKWISGRWMKWCERGKHYAERDLDGWTTYGGVPTCPDCSARDSHARGMWNAFMGR